MIDNKILELLNNSLKIILSGGKNNVEYQKIVYNLIENDLKKYYYIEKFKENKVFHDNIDYINLENNFLMNYENYRNITIFKLESTFEIKISKKGKIFIKEHKAINKNLIKNENNNQKKYIIKEGMDIDILIELGIFTNDYKIINKKYDKFKQINRFIEIIDDELKNVDNNKRINIIDFGCGKSYLTFILYYYLVKIKKLNINMIGVDLKEDVINKCNDLAKKYKYENLKFEIGNINGYKPKFNVDMVISLHACDIATDYALFNAIEWNSKYIFSVPCCQHELYNQIKSNDLKEILKYNIIKERMASLFTDSIRCLILEIIGYNVQILEFVDFDNSPKNLLIRAKKSNISQKDKNFKINELNRILKDFNINHTLYNLANKYIS